MAAGEPKGWWHYSLCSEPDREFYSEPKSDKEREKSKSVCRVCPVRLECLAHAFCTNTESGVFGGIDFEKTNRGTMIALFNLPIRAGEPAVVKVLIRRMGD